jgi:hypothetical protein
MKRRGIGVLALRRLRQAEPVPPSEIVPIIDVKGERENVAALGQFGRVKLSGRTGAAAFRREEFDYGRSDRGRNESRKGEDGGQRD